MLYRWTKPCMPVGCAAHTPEPMTPPMSAAVTPTVAREASSAPLTGSRRCIEPRPPLSATLTIRTEPEELPAIEVLNPPGRSMTFSGFPVRGDTRTSRSPATAHRAPPATDRWLPNPLESRYWPLLMGSFPVTARVPGSSAAASPAWWPAAPTAIRPRPAAR